MSAEAVRTRKQLELALGCIIHDLHILGAAVLQRHPGVASDESQRVAAEAVLVKGRALLQVFGEWQGKPRPHPDDILGAALGLEPWKISAGSEELQLIEDANKRSAHLTWTRAREQVDPLEYLERVGAKIFWRALAEVRALEAGGLAVSETRHQRHRDWLGGIEVRMAMAMPASQDP